MIPAALAEISASGNGHRFLESGGRCHFIGVSILPSPENQTRGGAPPTTDCQNLPEFPYSGRRKWMHFEKRIASIASRK